MKYHKAVYVTLQDIKGNLNRGDDVYANRVAKNERNNSAPKYAVYKDFSCQYDSSRGNVICTCKSTKKRKSGHFTTSRQVYRSLRYTSARGYTDVGVGSVKTVPKKMVRRIYLPDTEDRGIGSTDLSSVIWRTKHGENVYDRKKTSSKCVGGAMDAKDPAVLSEKLSPICKTKSGSTSPNRTSFEENYNHDNHLILPDPVFNLIIRKNHDRDDKTDKNKNVQSSTITEERPGFKTNTDKTNEASLPNTSKEKPALCTNDEKVEKDFSSDSLLQHVHNLENPSSFQQSKMSLNLIANTLEREYINMFSSKSKQNSNKPIAEIKPIQDCKSTFMRKRFEALRCGLSKKEVSKEQCIVINSSSLNSSTSRRDVSITSDPPSLVARSFTDTKKHSPTPSIFHNNEDVSQTSYRKPVTGRKESAHWSTDVVDGEYQNAKGMFKLWGKKFKLDEDLKNTSSYKMPVETKKYKKKVEIILPKEEVIDKGIKNEKREGKRFSFFKWKSKDKSKQSYKSKKGVTAGRCEVGDGLTIKIGAANEYSPETSYKKPDQIPDAYNDILRKAWLKRCLDNKNDSQKSVKIRWNNDMYATSSSTVFELMECIYKNTGIVFRSKSEVTCSTTPSTSTGEYRRYYNSQINQVNFMQQAIQAWMMPKIIRDNSIEKFRTIHNSINEKKKNIEVTFCNQKWFVEKSKTFSQKIELVLNTKNFVKDKDTKDSSKYIMIDIPKGYFSGTSCEDEERTHTSDEQVYNIVEYETVKSSSHIENKRTGDYQSNDIRVTINVEDIEHKESGVVETLNIPPPHRDVVVQGSNVYVPKRCDVVGVGIITQLTHNRDLSEIKKPILKMQEEITDDESTHAKAPLKKFDLAESYLEEYYRHWIPLGMDLYSWCMSDSNIRGSSDNNSLNSLNHQDDCSKSCPNIHDDYQTSAIVSSCETSSCSHYTVVEETIKSDDATKTYFNKIQKNYEELQQETGKRVLPKDSVEVFKRRKIYAASKKDNWIKCGEESEPFSVPSIGDKFSQKMSREFCTEWEPVNANPKKKLNKHVSLKEIELTKKIGDGILSYKGSFGCNISKKKESCSKLVRVNPESVETTAPRGTESRTKQYQPSCLKKDSQIAPPWAPNLKRRPLSPPQLPHSSRYPPPYSKSSPPLSRQMSPTNLSTPSCLEYCKKQKKSPCSETSPSRSQGIPPHYAPYLEGSPLSSPHSSSPSHTSPPRLTKSSPTSCRQKPTPPQQRSPPQTTQPCGCNPQHSCSSPQCLSNKSPCSSQILENQESLKSSKISLKKPASSKLATALKRLTKKCNSCLSKKNSKNLDTNSPKKNKEGKKERDKLLCPSSPCYTASNTRCQSRTGVHLTMKPIPKKSDKSQSNCNVIRLNSKENLYIRIKQTTPSTDEIRDPRNIKVQDEDGQTLYERHEYKMDTNDTRNHLVKDMYRDSRIHRVSTSKTEMVLDKKNLEPTESNASLSNIVEVNFNLKFKQADKTAINIKKDKPIDTQNEEAGSLATLKNVYVLQDKTKQSIDRIEDPEKRDVNIKIVINSYQQNPNKSKRNITNLNLHTKDDFTRKISEKFHTVSTGYSDVLDLQTYSLHKTTVNFSDSTDTSKHDIKPSEELLNKELTGKSPINSTDVESLTKQSTFECSPISSAANNTEVLPSDISRITGVSAIDNGEASLLVVEQSNIEVPKVRNKEEKKMILKQIFESSNDTKNTGNKIKIRSIRKMLRAVLTSDSSSGDDVTVNHELAKELTYQSLKPNYFKDSDSMTNYYHCGSMSDSRPSKNCINEILFPAERINSTDAVASNENQNLSCLCNHLATTLNTRAFVNKTFKTCCCGDVDKRDQEVDCNLTKDSLKFNKADYFDVQTQYSYLKEKHKKSEVKILSNTTVVPSQNVKPRKISYKIPKSVLSSNVKACPLKKLNRQTLLGLSDDDKVIILNAESNLQLQMKTTNRSSNGMKLKTLDILQLHETKKAVLEIYAENIAFDEGLVARLPKFVYNQENEICNYYQEMVRFSSLQCKKYRYDVKHSMTIS